MTRNVGIYIFDEVEVLDFAGPFEVFHTASRVWLRAHPDEELPFLVFTIGAQDKLVRARGELQVGPHYTLTNQPRLDVLVIPGGVTAADSDLGEVLVDGDGLTLYGFTPDVASSPLEGDAALLVDSRKGR